MSVPQTIRLINNPNNPSTQLINKFMHIHQQGQKYAVGDGMVGKPLPTAQKGGSKVKTFKLTGRGKRKKVYAEDSEKAAIVGFMLLVKPGRDSFSYKIDGKRYQGYRERATGKHPKGTKYYNFIQEE